MSAAIQVFLRDARVPTVDDWNAAIKAGGFDLILDPFDLRDDSAYRPAMLKGEESGFEWYLSPVAQAEELPESPFKAHIGDCDLKAALCFTSYADEDVTASIAGAVLAKLTGGYYWDAETDNRFLQGDAAIAAARRIVLEWERRGPFKAETELASEQPPIIATAAPPVISAPEPPPAANPPVVLRYCLWCGLFAVIYAGFVVVEILNARGVIEPPLGVLTDLLTRNDAAARAQVIADARERAFGGGVVGVLGAIFYGFAAFVPRKPWGWSVGRVAIIGTVLPFIVTVAVSTPLLISWMKPETKHFFSKEI